MKALRSMAAGIAGALVMSLAMYLMRMQGIPINLEGLLGSIFEQQTVVSPWVAGFLLHLAGGAIAGLVYATLFEIAIQRSGPLVGAGFGLAHGMLAGLFMSAIPSMNPLIPEAMAAPGAFLSNMDAGPVMFLLLHVLFGAVVDTLYGPPLQHAHVHRNYPV